ncbi:MAG: hypothetical protein ACXVCY_15235 [Pseudobdellovibrionaceae bacterium]
MKTKIKLLSLITIFSLEMILTAGCGNNRGNSSPTPTPTPTPNTLQENETTAKSDSHSDSNKPEATAETFSYWFIQNGCSTEKQTFDSKEALCKGLQDEDLNKNCAFELRKQKFNKVGCNGEFIEILPVTPKSNNGPSPIRCVGRVSGHTGEKKIDQTIHWDRKTFQKVVLSKFTDVKDAGEYSVSLIPHEDPTQPGAIKIFGWFIDNNKIQAVEGRLDSGVYFFHKDNNMNGREVEIECGLANPDIQRPSYTNEAKLEMTCLGSNGPIQGKKDSLTAHFFWDQQTPMTETLMLQKDGKNSKSDINLVVEVNKKNGLPTMKTTSDAIDGHVQLIGKVQGRMEFTIKYMSAWDERDIDIACAPTKVWNESIKKSMEKKGDETNK